MTALFWHRYKTQGKQLGIVIKTTGHYGGRVTLTAPLVYKLATELQNIISQEYKMITAATRRDDNEQMTAAYCASITSEP